MSDDETETPSLLEKLDAELCTGHFVFLLMIGRDDRGIEVDLRHRDGAKSWKHATSLGRARADAHDQLDRAFDRVEMGR